MNMQPKYSDDQLFTSTLVSLVPYLAFMLFPGTRVSYVIWSVVFLYMALLYSYCFLKFTMSSEMEPLTAYSLDQLTRSFRYPAAVLTVWAHTGAQDLITMLVVFLLNRYFVGVPRWAMTVLIPMIWMVGPMAPLLWGVVGVICKIYGWIVKPKTEELLLFVETVSGNWKGLSKA